MGRLALYASDGFFGNLDQHENKGPNAPWTFDVREAMGLAGVDAIGPSAIDTILVPFFDFAEISGTPRLTFFNDPLSVFMNGAIYPRMLKGIDPERKILLSIGGAKYPGAFALAGASDANAQAFAEAVATLCIEFGFDGIDLDYEAFAPAPVSIIPRIASAFKNTMEANGKTALLTAAPVIGAQDAWQDVLQATVSSKCPTGNLFDWFNVQSYAPGWETYFADYAGVVFDGTGISNTTPFLVMGWDGWKTRPSVLAEQVNSVNGKPGYGGAFMFNYRYIMGDHFETWVNAMQGSSPG